MLVKDVKTGKRHYDGAGERVRLKGTLKIYKDDRRLFEFRFYSKGTLKRIMQDFFGKIKGCEIRVMFDNI